MKKIISAILVALLFVSVEGVGFAASKKAEAAKEEVVVPRGERITPKKVEIDTDADGKVDRIEEYDKDGVITSIKSDVDKDGKFDEWLYYEGGKLVKAAKDSNGDGKEDTWLTY